MGRSPRDGESPKRGNSAPSSNAEARNSGGGDLQQSATGIRYAGGNYNGQLKGGKPYGQGRLDWDHGDIYEGEWKEGLQHGTGTYKWKDGDVYDGEWKDDLKHGRGEYKWKDGMVYEGGWENDKRHGRGTTTWPSGKSCEGEYAGGTMHGWGTMMCPSGKTYEGQWAEGIPHGKGTEKLPTGEICEGIWVKGEFVRRKLRSQRSRQLRLGTDKKACEHCGVDDFQYKLRVCSGCNLALYCSATCQKAARGSHRRICDIASILVPSRDSDRINIEYDKDKMVDLDAALHFAAKYMGNLKHLKIDLEKIGTSDAVRLTMKHISSLLSSKRGELASVFFVKVRVGPDSRALIELHGLKQLLLERAWFDDVQSVHDVICQQKDTLEVLRLPFLGGIDWSKAKTRRALVLAIDACKNLVDLDLRGCLLSDSDLKTMLHDLPNLRVLSLLRDIDDSHEFSDKTCGLIARKCPGLQLLNVGNHTQLSVRGIRKIFEGCANLRSFYTSTRKLSCQNVRSLLDLAPQLLYFSLDDEGSVSDGDLDEIIEATGGRTVFRFGYEYNVHVYESQGEALSAETREKYNLQRDVLRNIWKRQRDPDVANEWAVV